MDVELNELHHIVLHTVVVLSLNNKQWATRPRRCTAAAALRTWGRGAAPWPRGARFLARVTAEQLAHFPLDERWGFQLPGDMSAGQKYLCQLVKMCEKVKLEKKEKGTKKKKKGTVGWGLGLPSQILPSGCFCSKISRTFRLSTWGSDWWDGFNAHF